MFSLFFSLLHVSLIPSPGGNPVSPSRLHFKLLLLRCWDSHRPQVEEAGTDPCFPQRRQAAGSPLRFLHRAASWLSLASPLGCCWLDVGGRIWPLVYKQGVVLSLSPSATGARARISTACCRSRRAAASVDVTPRGQGARGKVGTVSGPEE